MLQRAAESIREEISFLGPLKRSDVETAQQSIVDIVRRLEEAGEVSIAGRDGEGEMID
jgi:flagellar motor switch protein FliG